MPGYTQGFTRQLVVEPKDTGFNLTSIDAAADSNAIECKGYNQLSIQFFHDYAAATGVEWYVAAVDPSGNEYLHSADDDGGSGVFTNYDYKRQRTTGADDYWTSDIPINCERIMLKNVVGQGSPSGDKLTVRMIFSVV